MKPDKSIEEKLDILLESNARLEQVVIGDEKNCIPGLCGRVKRLEDGLPLIASIAGAIGFGVGTVLKGFLHIFKI